ncbi:hypothetical protein AX17_003756 [Amanita inopinata Kibby_2008]|nr:hypothetical protein AX17_003756 [Amanita inopinata Kibby_2008]
MTDIVSVEALNLSATVGADCWGKIRPQPISISIHVHLTPEGFLSRAGQSDDVKDTVHYGHLTKSVMKFVEGGTRDGGGFRDVGELIDGVAEKAFELAGDDASKVRVVVGLSKMVLLAQGGIIVETTSTPNLKGVRRKVWVKDLVFSIIVGVNEPERKDKQRVMVNLEVFEWENATIIYPDVVRALVKDVDHMEYLTLEKMVWEIARATCLLLGQQVEKVTVRAQKPSALSFAQSSGVEMTRKLSDFK